jgi:tripartite-type tricarboxylate transporter receptor subunit TctC
MLRPWIKRSIDDRGNMRRFIGLLAGLVLAPVAVAAQVVPLPPGNVTIVVPLAAGGPLDAVARLLANSISQRSKRTIVVENRPGAAGNIGSAAAAKAAPNGLTWLVTVDSVYTINPHVYAKQGFDPDKDLDHVGQIGQVILMLAVNASKVPSKTWAELLALSAAKPLNFGSAGNGSPGHLALEHLKQISAFKAAHVPFRGAAPALNELVAGNVEGAFIVSGVLLEHVRSGKLRALAVSDSRRLATFPDVPTAAEAGIPNFEAKFSNVLSVPAGTPAPIRAYLERELVAFSLDEAVRARFAALGTEMLATNGAATRAWVAQERARWGKVIAAAGIKSRGAPAKPK